MGKALQVLALGFIGGFVFTLVRTGSLLGALAIAPIGAIAFLGTYLAYHRFERDRNKAKKQDSENVPPR